MDSVVKLVCNGIYVKFQPQMDAPSESEGEGSEIRKRTRPKIKQFLAAVMPFISAAFIVSRSTFPRSESSQLRFREWQCFNKYANSLHYKTVASCPIQFGFDPFQSSFVLVAATEQHKRKSNVARSDNWRRIALLIPFWDWLRSARNSE